MKNEYKSGKNTASKQTARKNTANQERLQESANEERVFANHVSAVVFQLLVLSPQFAPLNK